MQPFRRSIHAVILRTVLLVAARPAAAQLAKSVDVGLPFGPSGETGAAAFQLGFRVASLKPQAPGVDFAIATLPVAWAYGIAVVSSDLDLTYPVPLGGGVTLAPRAGASVLVAALFAPNEEGGAGAMPGYNVGLGLVGRTGPTSAIRADFTRRSFDGVAVSSVTIGFAWTP